MATRRGPISDETGTYYLVYPDDGGPPVKEYVTTAAAPAPAGPAPITDTTVAADGSIQQTPTPATAAPVVPPPGELDAAADTTAAATASPSGDDGGRGYAPQRGYSRYYDDGSASGYASGYSPGSSSGPTIPRYADGSTAPYFGGPFRTPGGFFAAGTSQGGESYDARQQVYVPGGAAAGPFETRAAYSPETPVRGGFAAERDYDGGGGGGGGGSQIASTIRGIESRLRGNVLDRVGAMFGGGGGGSSYPSFSSGSSRKYRRQQRRARQQQRQIQRAADQYYEDVQNPEPLPVSGILKQMRVSPEGAPAFMSNPQIMLPRLGEKLQPNNAGDEATMALPVVDLALMSKTGTRGRGLTSKTPFPDFPNILKRADYDEVKPEVKRLTDPSKVADQVSGIYQDWLNGKGLPSTTSLLRNLSHASKGSALGGSLIQQYKTDPGGAMNAVNNYVTSALVAGMADDPFRDATIEYAQTQFANDGAALLRGGAKGILNGTRRYARGILRDYR